MHLRLHPSLITYHADDMEVIMRFAAIAVISIFLIGCSTPYQSSGMRGGFEDMQLSENSFRVSFTGNGFTSASDASNMMLLRAAEISIENGFKYSAKIDSENNDKQYLNDMSSTSRTTGTISNYGATSHIDATTTTKSGITLVNKPSRSITIVCFNEKPSGYSVMDANIVYQSLSAKYKK